MPSNVLLKIVSLLAKPFFPILIIINNILNIIIVFIMSFYI